MEDNFQMVPNVVRSGVPASLCNSHGVRLVRTIN
jgi:hypothetical protein